MESTGKQLGFYWINGDQLVTVTSSKDPYFTSGKSNFISGGGLWIQNNRKKEDLAILNS